MKLFIFWFTILWIVVEVEWNLIPLDKQYSLWGLWACWLVILIMGHMRGRAP